MTKPRNKAKVRATGTKKPTTRKRTQKRAPKHSVSSRLASFFATSALILVCIALITFALGLHTVILEHVTFQPTAPRATLAGSTPNIITSDATTCGGAKQSDAAFSTCPDFLVTYANRHTGTVSTDIFNIYSGAPVANQEAQYYTAHPENIFVANGSLSLKAIIQSYNGYKYTSARIDTKGKEDFLYGKLVIRATLPTGMGTWPAIWMLPSQPKYASQSPASDVRRYINDGEIDIAEVVGLQPHLVYGVAHSRAYPEDGINRTYFNTTLVADSDRTYHDYEVDWTPASLTYRVDGKAFYIYHKKAGADWRSWPFDQPYYLVINFALGGTWAGSNVADFPGDGIDPQALPATLQVQSIRYYSLAQ